MGKQNYKVVASANKSFIRVIIVVIIVFIATAALSMRLISYLYYEEIKGNSTTMAQNYANELSNSHVALETISSLIDDRMELTVKLVTKSSENLKTNQLVNVAREYNIREINIFDQDGKIRRSNIYKQIGWEITQDHPAYEFFNDDGDKEIFIEDIRKDVLSKRFMKYTYCKTDGGNIVQIGFTADVYYDLIEHFQVNSTLRELNKFPQIMGAQLIDNSLNIAFQESSVKNYEFEVDESKKRAIIQEEEYFNKTYCCGEDVYEVMIPVYRGERKLGTLAISYSISNLIENLRWIYIITVPILTLIFLIIARAIYKLSKKNKRLTELVYYDQLTGLPNLDYLIEYFSDTKNEILEQKNDINRAIILIDIINFKLVFLTHGYEQGENIFKQISNHINSILRSSEKLFRIAENQFIVYVEEYTNKEYLVELSSRINLLFTSDLKELNVPKHVNVKIGINEVEDSSEDILNIIKNAHIAAQSTLDASCNCEFFSTIMEQEIIRENHIENEIEDFINNKSNNIYLDYQPQLDLRTNKISGFEGLARMKTERLGQVSPLEFIPIAEKNNSIIELGLILLKKACIFLEKLNKQGFNNMMVAVNVSGIQILRDEFYDNVIKIIEETNINPKCLEIEITESIFIENFDIVNKNLMRLKKIGISIAIDDFGTGYSSLERLGGLCIDRLKIDKSFIDKITTSRSEEVIIGDIISLAHKIDLKTVAEGVELKKQKDYLIDNNCDTMQGYLFSKPVSKETALEMLKREN